MIEYYVGLLSDPDVLRGSFGVLSRVRRDAGAERSSASTGTLTMPVLAIGGERSYGDARRRRDAARSPTTCRASVIPGAGHWVAEEAPEATVAALTAFLAPYREGGGRLR